MSAVMFKSVLFNCCLKYCQNVLWYCLYVVMYRYCSKCLNVLNACTIIVVNVICLSFVLFVLSYCAKFYYSTFLKCSLLIVIVKCYSLNVTRYLCYLFKKIVNLYLCCKHLFIMRETKTSKV